MQTFFTSHVHQFRRSQSDSFLSAFRTVAKFQLAHASVGRNSCYKFLPLAWTYPNANFERALPDYFVPRPAGKAFESLINLEIYMVSQSGYRQCHGAFAKCFGELFLRLNQCLMSLLLFGNVNCHPEH